MNEFLLTPEQIKIRKLELAIQKFKEYDAMRKKHYSSLEMEIEMLKSEIDELRDENERLKQDADAELINQIAKLRAKIKGQKQNLSILQAKVLASKYPDIVYDETTISKIAHKSQIKDFKERIKKARILLERLICQLNRPELQEKVNQLCNIDDSGSNPDPSLDDVG